ncbi:MAG: hypothetical protein JSS82_12540 [Bacteroidetes bacterium]|nr:hypothetical protein [Bacteroidota bacterium]
MNRSAFIRELERKQYTCAQCGKVYRESDNLGQLQCYKEVPYFHGAGSPVVYNIAQDHSPANSGPTKLKLDAGSVQVIKALGRIPEGRIKEIESTDAAETMRTSKFFKILRHDEETEEYIDRWKGSKRMDLDLKTVSAVYSRKKKASISIVKYHIRRDKESSNMTQFPVIFRSHTRPIF